MRALCQFFFILGVIILIGCEYEPDGSFYKEMLDNSQQAASINLNDYNSETDTVRIYTHTIFYYNLVADSLKIYDLVVYLDSVLIDTLGTDREYVSINPENYSNGYHALSFEIITNTGSNSMADLANYEYRKFYKTFILGMETSMSSCVYLNSAKKENGHLKLVWSRYNGMFFDNYEIYRKSKDYSFHVATIEDVNQLSCFDDGYLGGNATYRIYAHFRDKTTPLCTTLDYNDDYLKFYPNEVVNNQYVRISWTKCRYENAYKSAYLSHHYQAMSSGVKTYFNSENINDTSALAEVYFGKQVQVSLSMKGKTDGTYYSSSQFYVMGDSFPTFNRAVTGLDTNFVYLLDDTEVRKHRVSDGALIQGYTYSTINNSEALISVSPDNQKLALFDKGKVIILDGNTLQQVDKIIMTSFGVSSPKVEEVVLTTSNKVLINYGDYNGGYLWGFLIYDLDIKDTLLTRIGKLPDIHRGSISPSGEYLVDGSYNTSILYAVDSDFNLNYIGETQNYLRPVANAFDIENKKFTCFTINTAYVYSLENFEILNAYSINHPVYNYNIAKGLILVRDNDYDNNLAYLIKPTTGEIVDRISIAYNTSTIKYQFYSFGNKLLASSGFILNLK